jgi:hypothetical protein
MSTIIRILRWLRWASIVLIAWAAIMVSMPFVGPSGRRVAVVGDASTAVRAITAAGGQVLEVRRGAVLTRADRAGFVMDLYRGGAPLVLEGRIAAGCFQPARAGA